MQNPYIIYGKQYRQPSIISPQFLKQNLNPPSMIFKNSQPPIKKRISHYVKRTRKCLKLQLNV